MEKKNILSRRVLTHANRHTPVCLMNPTNNPVVIRKCKMVGSFEPNDEVQENTKHSGINSIGKDLQEQLQILLEKSSEHIDKAQSSKLKATASITKMCLHYTSMKCVIQKLLHIK